MDWDNCIADVEMLLDTHYTAGRSGSIKYIVLHHNAGNLTVEDCHRVWQTREASAHYQVDINGLIGQLVNDWDTAWHAGDANPWSIGIEHANNNSDPWTISDATLEAGAHLVAALCKKYELGRPEWLHNVYPHSYFMATACPGEIAGSQNAAYMERAQYWYDVMMGGESASTPAPNPEPEPEPTPTVEPIRYRVYTQNNGWLSEMQDRYDTGRSGDTYAGDGSPILYLAMGFPGWYQVCTEKQGWLPRVNQYNIDDLENGCAGDGSPITGVRCYYETPNPDATGWRKIEYAVANVGCDFFAPMQDETDTGGSSDGYAGNGSEISAIWARAI